MAHAEQRAAQLEEALFPLVLLGVLFGERALDAWVGARTRAHAHARGLESTHLARAYTFPKRILQQTVLYGVVSCLPGGVDIVSSVLVLSTPLFTSLLSVPQLDAAESRLHLRHDHGCLVFPLERAPPPQLRGRHREDLHLGRRLPRGATHAFIRAGDTKPTCSDNDHDHELQPVVSADEDGNCVTVVETATIRY